MSSQRLITVLPPALMAAAAFALPLGGCSSRAASPGSAPAVPAVTVAPPARELVQDSLQYTGRVEAVQRVEVRSRVSGYLSAIQFRDGQLVKAGTPLFVIDQRPFLAMRDRARAALAAAEARYQLAHTQYERTNSLQGSGAASAEDRDLAQGEYDGAKAAVQVARAELRNAELELEYSTVSAPITGRISDHRIDVGNYVSGGGSQGGVLATIVATDTVRAMVDLPEADYQRLRRNGALPKQVSVSVQGVQATRQADIDFVDSETSSRSGTIRLRASVPNPDGVLVPGYFAQVKVPVGPRLERLLVPDALVQNDQNRKLVMVVDGDGKAVPRAIETGALVGNKRVVLAGLAPDERVIVSGAGRVKPGERVTATPAPQGM